MISVLWNIEYLTLEVVWLFQRHPVLLWGTLWIGWGQDWLLLSKYHLVLDEMVADGQSWDHQWVTLPLSRECSHLQEHPGQAWPWQWSHVSLYRAELATVKWSLVMGVEWCHTALVWLTAFLAGEIQSAIREHACSVRCCWWSCRSEYVQLNNFSSLPSSCRNSFL